MNRTDGETSATHVDEVVDRLRELGLPADEARVYIQLVRLGPVKVSALAQSSGLSRSKVYRVVENLTKRGLVSSVYGRPVRFQASAPENLVEILTTEARASLERTAHLGREVVPVLQELSSTKAQPGQPNAFKLLQGREAYWRVMRRTLGRARHEARILCTHQSTWLSGESGEMWRSLERRAREGLQVRILHGRDAYVGRQFESLARLPTVEIRDFEAANVMRTFIADADEIILSLVIDPAHWARATDDVTLWTSARDFVASQVFLFEALWRQSRNEPGLPQVTALPPLPTPTHTAKAPPGAPGWGARRREE